MSKSDTMHLSKKDFMLSIILPWDSNDKLSVYKLIIEMKKTYYKIGTKIGMLGMLGLPN